MSPAKPLPRILHLHAAFDAEGGAARCARLIGAMADAEHAVISGDPARRGAAALIDRRRKVAWPKFPPLAGKPWPGRLKRLAQAMAGYDLICTCGPGALDAALAHTLFADVFKLAPLIHHEDEESGRSFYRRIALGRTAALVVPTRRLERMALETWQQPRSRVRLIPDGIDTRAFAKPPKRDALPNLIKRKGELWLGAHSPLHRSEDVLELVQALEGLPEDWQLVVVGEVPAADTVLAEAERLGLDHRVHLVGPADSPAVLPLFDIFATSAGAVEAMAVGLPIIAPPGSEAAESVASENGPYLSALPELAANPALRKRVGEANRAKARAEFDHVRMVERYRALYANLIGRE